MRHIVILFIIIFLPVSLGSYAADNYHVALGQIYLERGQIDKAEQEVEEALKDNPHDQEAADLLEKINQAKSGKGYGVQPVASSKQPRMPQEQVSPPAQQYFQVEPIKKEVKATKQEAVKEPLEAGEKEKPILDVKGEVRIGLGFTSDDFIWKDANADKQGIPGEKNWRYLWGKDRFNTYDKEVYQSLKLSLDTNFKSPWNMHALLAIDPWTYVGVAEVDIPRNRESDGTTHPPTDWARVRLKYWSGSRSTIDEVYRSRMGNIVTLPEIKVIDGKTVLSYGDGATEGWGGFGMYQISPSDIHYMYRPLREFFVDYKADGFNFRFFPIAYQDQAYTSNDPLKLSNNHIWWEESPWLDSFEPSVQFTRAGNPIQKAQWVRRFSFVSRDSQLQRLVFLRGFSFNAAPTASSALDFTMATPMTLWDEYTDANSLEQALRFNWDATNDLSLGFISTAKLGLDGSSLEAQNYLWGTDYRYSFSDDIGLYGEVAGTYSSFEEADGYKDEYPGYAFMQGFDIDKLKLFWAYLDRDFYPGLSNYRYTREDLYYSRHLNFFELYPEDEAFRIGNSIDTGRQVAGLRFEDDFFDKRFHLLYDFRNAHKDTGKYLETISRLETTSKINDKLTLKTLFWYKHLPSTIGGLDPLINTKNIYSFTDFFSDQDEPVMNSAILDGKDPSIGHFSIGAKYDFTDWFSFIPIYERTNDPVDFPRTLLNNVFYQNVTIDGRVYDEMVPFLYNQNFFSLPPYDYYSILKLKALFTPSDKWDILLSYTKNTNKYETGIDDNINHTGLEVKFRPTQKLTLSFEYMLTRFIDLYNQVIGNGIDYGWHNNFFTGLRYDIDETQYLDLLFGEFIGYGDPYYSGRWSLSAVDTQHIVRLFYKKKF
jgi:hypothetical protein